MDYSKYYKKDKIKPKDKAKFEHEKSNYNIDVGESKSIDKTIYILLITALIIIPLFIKAHISEFISPHLTFMSTGMQADIFSYYKYTFLIIVTILVAILFIYKVLFLQYSIPKSKINLFLGLLAITVTLSAVFSPYKSIALHGMYNRHEGTLTFICYLVLFFVASNMKYKLRELSGFLYILYPFVIINAILGWLIWIGVEASKFGFVKSFVFGGIPEGSNVSSGWIWATLSNPNYISGIGSMLTILFLTWAIFDQSKIRTVINVMMAFISYFIVLTSLSTSGFLTLLVLLPVIIVFIFAKESKLKSFVVLLSFFILATSIYTPLANKNPRLWDETFGFFIKENPFKNEKVSKMHSNPIEFNKGKLDILLSSKVYAEENNADSSKFNITKLPESGVTPGNGRIYIWQKTLETAMQRPLIGYGLDAYSYVFPQNDINKNANLEVYNIIVDKPHNMYLGLLVGSGAFALLFFILLMSSITINGIRILFKKKSIQAEDSVTIALFLSTIAYCIQGFLNDSVIGAAVVFWILLGVLVSNLSKLDGGHNKKINN